MISGADSLSEIVSQRPFSWSQNLHNAFSNLWCFCGARGCSSASAVAISGCTHLGSGCWRTHLSPGLFQGNESSVQQWQSPSKQEGKCGPVFQLLLSSLQICRLIEAFSEDNFGFSRPSFPCLIRNRSVFLWLDSLNSPWGAMWNKRINYFKTQILSSLGIKLESVKEKHRRFLLRWDASHSSPPDGSPLFRFQSSLTLL